MATEHGAFEWIKVPDPANPGGTIKKWVRDSWARRKIVSLQQAIASIIVPPSSTSNPQMDGTASPGTSAAYAREDHVHPSDTSKQDALSTAQLAAINSGITAAKVESYEQMNAFTLTRTENSYVNATSFGRISVRKIGPHLAVMGLNLQLSAAFTANDLVTIGKINNFSAPSATMMTVPSQSAYGANSSSLLLYVTTNGTIQIFTQNGAANEWYRASVPIVIN